MTRSAVLTPVTLTGIHAQLEPLDMQHSQGIQLAVQDGELWRLWYTDVPKPEGVDHEIQRRLNLHAQGTMLPFAVRRLADQALVGMTTYMNIDVASCRLEIGSTWYAASAQRTAINTECKFLLLQHAFEHLGCIAVEFRTHWLNQRSRAAIARLGAKQDGILRSHRRLPDGSLRDTVVFSIIASEWPSVRNHLRAQLDARQI